MIDRFNLKITSQEGAQILEIWLDLNLGDYSIIGPTTFLYLVRYPTHQVKEHPNELIYLYTGLSFYSSPRRHIFITTSGTFSPLLN